MMDRYYVVRQDAVPEVLLKVLEVKKLIEDGEAASVLDAVDMAGLSRSSFYKYRDCISQLDDHARGKTISLSIDTRNVPGALSGILKTVADYNANILTIHQSVPVGGRASISLSVEIGPETGNISDMVEKLEAQKNIKSVRLLSGE